jgi:hypothetical protein
MTTPCYHLNNQLTSTSDDKNIIKALESGQILFIPNCFFKDDTIDTTAFLTETILDKKHKNISFDYNHLSITGYSHHVCSANSRAGLIKFMQGYADFANSLIIRYLPQYSSALRWGRTSYRPTEIKGRTSSRRKDDTRLHIDSFAATPVNGQRILRVFCNINPYGQARSWQVGESFAAVVNYFAPNIPSYHALKAKGLHLIGATKTLRSAYDHYQLQLHDRMKLDEHYQQHVTKQPIDFPAYSTWIVFTDQVSHAVLSGQFLLEQTFYLPVSAMAYPELSPFSYWQKERKITTN